MIVVACLQVVVHVCQPSATPLAMVHQTASQWTSSQLFSDCAAVTHGRSRSAVLQVRRAQRLSVQGFREREDVAVASRGRPASEPRHAAGNRGRSAVRPGQSPSQQRAQQMKYQDVGPAASADVTRLPALPVLRRAAWRLMGRGGPYRSTSRERDSIDAAARGAVEAAEQAAAVRTDPTGAAGTPIGRFGLSSARVCTKPLGWHPWPVAH